MKKISGFLFLCLIPMFTLLGQEKNEKLIDRLVATVGNSIILQSDVDKEYMQYLASGGTPDNSFKCKVMQQLIITKLLAQQAVIDSVEVSESEVDDRLNDNMRNMVMRAGGEERLQEFLKRPLLQYKEEIRPTLSEQMRAEKLQQTIVQKISVTPAEVQKYFNNLDKDSLPYFNTEVEIGEIVVNAELSKEEKEVFKRKCEEFRKKVLDGTDFGTVARFYSEDGSAARGGELGFATRNLYVKEFSAVAFKLKPGELSQVFETEYGFHFLQVLERRGEEVNVRHVLVQLKPTPASLDRAKQKIDSIYNLVSAKKIGFHTAASINSDNEMTKFTGGMVADQNSYTKSTFLPVEGLEKDVFTAIDTLKPGGFTKPYLFTSKIDGKQAYKFNYLKTRIAPHAANLDQDFAKIKEAAQSDKVNRTLSEWFEKRTATTYIDVNEDFGTCDDLKMWLSDKNDKSDDSKKIAKTSDKT